ncbi:MAG: hypothetical protein M4579_005003 [Chaenotheca gracillima]|nr:MAG: hypothetical protein M4579_005003 [Chaenotheca gracillima]
MKVSFVLIVSSLCALAPASPAGNRADLQKRGFYPTGTAGPYAAYPTLGHGPTAPAASGAPFRHGYGPFHWNATGPHGSWPTPTAAPPSYGYEA